MQFKKPQTLMMLTEEVVATSEGMPNIPGMDIFK